MEPVTPPPPNRRRPLQSQPISPEKAATPLNQLSPSRNFAASAHPHTFSGVDEDDTFRVQDAQFGGLFLYFLQTFTLPDQGADPAANVSDNGEENKQKFAKGAPNGEGANAAEREADSDVCYYVNKAHELLLSGSPEEGRDFRTFRVDMRHMLMWKPPNDTVTAGKQLYMYVMKYYLRVFEVLELKLQQFLDGILNSELHDITKEHYFLSVNNEVEYIHSVRDLKCEMLGELIAIRGQVTRTSDVRPELRLASFKCNECGNVINNVQQQFRYTTPLKCQSSRCTNLHDWELLMDQCVFVDWQKIRLQESALEAHSGAMPRSIDIIARNDLIDKVHAGDRVIVTGCLTSIPDLPALMRPGEVPRSVARSMMRRNELSNVAQGITGIKGVGVKDLGHKLCFLAYQIETLHIGAKVVMELDQHADEGVLKSADIFEDPMLGVLCDVARSPNYIDKLTESIAPRIWGHREIKKGVLLMMVGGVGKASKNAKLRGDINMCIVGDPSTAKSQMLKFVEDFAPRAIFASGKGSTAAGLTAAVHKDPDQGDYVLEAGALMYADQGICCIDEFDKMDEKDRTAIHEAMEQQTISITKAGIQATLNARASVFAACNPKYGRYDLSKSFSHNVNIPAPLLSRFDLFYTMLDQADEANDLRVSGHLLKFHEIDDEEAEMNADFSQTLTTDELRLYIEISKRLRPIMTDEAKQRLVRYYVSLRTNDTQAGMKRSLRMTVRQLESLIRLSEAAAKLQFSDYVTSDHVNIACGIFRSSLQKVTSDQEVFLEDIDNTEDKTNEDGSLSQSRVGEENKWGSQIFSQQSAADDESKRVGKQPLSIPSSEYERVSSLLLDRIREYENFNSEGIASNDLIEWFVDEILKVESIEDANQWSFKLQRIIHRMIEIDNKLLSDPTNKQDIWMLRVHPNFSGASDFTEFKVDHTSFGYRNFDSEQSQQVEDFDLDEEVLMTESNQPEVIKASLDEGENVSGSQKPAEDTPGESNSQNQHGLSQYTDFLDDLDF